MRIIKIFWPLTALLAGLNSQVSLAKSSDDNDETLVVEATAEQVLKQQPGVSIITSEDIKKNPPVNDLSDIIRKMPGVNLTGNSASGTRGNNRQIDIRGMGPENTLILIDGVPVTSRNAVRYSWRGERDTRGGTLRFGRSGRGGEHHYQTPYQRLARFAVVIHQPAGKQRRRRYASRQLQP